MTWSPFARVVTPGPTSTTTPAPSCPRIAGNRPSGSAPERVNSSVWQMPVALISTSTSPAFGPSRRTFSITRGAPALCATAARTSKLAGGLRAVHVREHGALRLLVVLGLEGVAVLEGDRFRRSRVRADLVHQPLHVGELRRVLAEDVRHQPRPAPKRHVDDGVRVARQVLALRQARLDD